MSRCPACPDRSFNGNCPSADIRYRLSSLPDKEMNVSVHSCFSRARWNVFRNPSAKRICCGRSMQHFRGAESQDMFHPGQLGQPVSSFSEHLGPSSRSMRSIAMPTATPIVFVVDDDISIRESLESLIDNAG